MINMTYKTSVKLLSVIDKMFESDDRVKLVGGLTMATMDRLSIKLKEFTDNISMLDAEENGDTIQFEDSYGVHINRLLSVSGSW
ncbi:hypothetical protein Aeh1ORF291c [Aeromonas phage Aeh1]|uniref:Uncharacterized protein n=1 Tax=Aeromonas phage Aeh1 TaxID=2880362 RepID=Q76YD5_9CAUD|nr:hypothetical protein Aeh1p310 [Aeromonas phage Aeh1]AAQ17960.1 hypothetical protein Aeh1ORF291c [Aeromonas phage Aeh1]